jgi:predicted small lipoprotein YifL
MKTGFKFLVLGCAIFTLANCGIKPKHLEPRESGKHADHPRDYPSSK